MLKAAVPALVDLSGESGGPGGSGGSSSACATWGLTHGLRSIEPQNPETAFVLAGALAAYPGATAVHVLRDGRDVRLLAA